MRISRFAVHRPIFTIMVVLIAVLLGTVSLMRLPIDLMPDISYPTISIYCNYENAGPEEIEELISRPIEEAMSAVPGVEEVTSTSIEGRGTIRVTFAWGTDLDAAANDIRDRLDRVMRYLPDDADRPALRKFDLASFPILIMGASSKLDPVKTRRIIEDEVEYRLERVPGVAAVNISGTLCVGDTIHVQGEHTDFTQVVESMEIDRNPVEKAEAGQAVGMKVAERVRPNDRVYRVVPD